MSANKANDNSEAHRFKWRLFIAGLVAIVVGYIMLAMADTTLAPILLVLGYCVLIPLSFL
jgi:uncharacterized membrane protein HdeD (DUF308 family)